MKARWEADDIVEERNLEHWVCFECNKMFKRPSRRENDYADPRFPVRAYECPECSQQMINMGLYFEPPRRGDLAAWQRMRLLAEFGYFFYNEGSKKYIEVFLLGKPPVSVRQLRKHLILEKECSSARLRRWHNRYLKELKQHKARLRCLKLNN